VTPRTVIALQRQAGNVAVRQMIQRARRRVRSPRLHVGSHGDAVRDLQKKLNDAGARPRLKEDGVFARHVVAAVIRFQRAHHLTPDGVAGAKTLAALTAAQPSPVPEPAEPEPQADLAEVDAPVGAAERVPSPGDARRQGDLGDVAAPPGPLRPAPPAGGEPQRQGDLDDLAPQPPRPKPVAAASEPTRQEDLTDVPEPAPSQGAGAGDEEYAPNLPALPGTAAPVQPEGDEEYAPNLPGLLGTTAPVAPEAPAPSEEEDPYRPNLPIALRAAVPVERVASALGEEMFEQLVAPTTAAHVPKYVADLNVNPDYLGRGKRVREAESINSEADVLMHIGLITNYAKKYNRPFRAEFQRNFGWSDADIDKYLDTTRQGGEELKPSSGIHVQYLNTDEERKHYEVTGSTLTYGHRTPPETVDTGKMFAKASGTGSGIYAMDADGRIYLGTHNVGLFHHSSFLAGGAAAAAGDMKVTNGVPTFISNHSGHYKPETRHLLNVLYELIDRGVPLQPSTTISIATGDKDRPIVCTLEQMAEGEEELARRLGFREKAPA
jgi:peptidoglycan hydrolase-like protein with peptidoglycan-binding domain